MTRKISLIALITGLCFFPGMSQVNLLVCKPGSPNTPTIQTELDALIGQGKAVAFGRIKDLEGMLATATNNPMIIGPAPFVELQPDYKIILTGKSNNESGQKYYIISASKTVTKSNLEEQKIGIVDFLGREKLQAFVKDLFAISPKILKRVNKNEDLLTMLGMEAVDAIILSASEYKELLSNTKLPLTILDESSKLVGFIVCAAKTGNENAEIKKTLLNASSSLYKELGITKWGAQ